MAKKIAKKVKNGIEKMQEEGYLKSLSWLLTAIALTGLLLSVDDITKVFIITAIALFLFTTEKFPVELTALIIMVILMLFGLVTPQEGVSGFSSEATITVLAMFVLSAGIQRTGLIHTLGRTIFRFAGNSEIRQILCITLIVGPISGFMNNTAAVAIMLPMILDLSRRANTPATKILIPLSFVSMAGGMLTVIGTSTNILANSLLRERRLDALDMFSFTHVGAIVLLITILFFVLGGHWLLPKRKNIQKDENISDIEDDFFAEIVIEKNSPLIGKSLNVAQFEIKQDVQVAKLIRKGQSFVKDAKKKKLEEGDVIVLLVNQQRLIDLDTNEKLGIKLLLDFDEDRRRLPNGGGQIIKLMVRSASRFQGRSLDQVNFWDRFGAAVVGLHREDISAKRLADINLKVGEILLVKAALKARAKFHRSPEFLVIEAIESEFAREKMWNALLIMAGVILLSAFGVLPIMVAALSGVVLMILTKCLEPEDLYEAVSWDVIFLLAGIIPLGIAMQTSGATDVIANLLAGSASYLPPILILGLFYIITTLLTEIVSNNASVVILIPVAISVADKLFLNPIAFVLAVMFAASTSFLTPVGYQTNTMVFGAGNYKFSDFIKVGAPLNLLLTIVTTLLIAYFWGVERGI